MTKLAMYLSGFGYTVKDMAIYSKTSSSSLHNDYGRSISIIDRLIKEARRDGFETIKTTKKIVVPSCVNCIHEASYQEEMMGRPCKAVKKGFPVNDEDGYCSEFKAINPLYKFGVSHTPDSMFTRIGNVEL